MNVPQGPTRKKVRQFYQLTLPAVIRVDKGFGHDNGMIHTALCVYSQSAKRVVKYLLLGFKVRYNIAIELSLQLETIIYDCII